MNINNIILNLKRDENAGLGRIFRELRKIHKLEMVGDIVLYKSIINILSLNGYKISERSITRHFENIDHEDYDLVDKMEIIRDLKRGAIESCDKFTKGRGEVINDSKINHNTHKALELALCSSLSKKALYV